jgi:hypothetical protein
MTAHQDTGAAEATAPTSASDKAADFENFLFGDEEEEETDSDNAAEEGEDLELDDEGEEANEPEAVIEAPISLNAEEKEAFAAASPEAQQAWAASETRRNQQVQEATTKAAERERNADTKAAQAEALADQKRAAQLKAFIEPFRPQMPDPQLAYHDPASYIAAKAQFDAASAQFTEYEQHIEALQVQAADAASQIDAQARVSDLMTVGKLADPATRDEYVKTSLALVQELGLDPMAFENVAGSEDFKALEKIAEWKAKAARLDSAMARKMSKVRSAKGKSLRPGAVSHDTSRAANSSWDRVKSAKSKSSQAAALGDWMEGAGII